MVRSRLATSLKLAGIAAISACACALWLQAPALDSIRLSTWRGIGFTVAIIIGAIGASQIRAWLLVPVVVAAGLTAGATWTDWRIPSDVHVSFIENLVSAISNYGWGLIVPGVMASTLGVVVVRLRPLPLSVGEQAPRRLTDRCKSLPARARAM